MAHTPESSSRDLVLWLLEQGQQPRHLKPSLSDRQSLLNAGLEEVIRLREQGEPELSLALVGQLERAGLTSPWLADNRARALLALGQRDQALQHWRELSAHADQAAARVARDTLQQLVLQLLQGLLQHCSFHSWTPQHLPSTVESTDGDLLHLALQEAIASREANRAGLSLALMEEALQQGWTSAWVLDNRARALVNLDRASEAQQIWEELQTSADHAAAAMAAEALAILGRARQRLDVQQRAEALLAQGQQAEAQELVLETLALEPDDAALQDLLDRSLAMEPGSTDALLNQVLTPVNRTLQRHALLLSQLEQQLGG